MDRKNPQRERGQGMVEFALILPILLLTALLFLYVAELFHTWSGMQTAAVAGARYVSDTGAMTNLTPVVQQALANQSVDAGSVQIQWTLRNGDGSLKICVGPCPVEFGDLITVQLTRPFDIGVLDWRATGQLRAGHEVRVQHGTWVP